MTNYERSSIRLPCNLLHQHITHLYIYYFSFLFISNSLLDTEKKKPFRKRVLAEPPLRTLLLLALKTLFQEKSGHSLHSRRSDCSWWSRSLWTGVRSGDNRTHRLNLITCSSSLVIILTVSFQLVWDTVSFHSFFCGSVILLLILVYSVWYMHIVQFDNLYIEVVFL